MKTTGNNASWGSLKSACTNRSIVIFGASQYIYDIFSFAESENVFVRGVVDNDFRKQGHILRDIVGAIDASIDDLVIKSPSVLSGIDPDSVVICIASVHYPEISRQLLEFGKFDCYAIPVLLQNEGHYNNDARNLVRELTCLPIQKNKIFIQMDFYGGHGKYITMALLNGNNSLDIVWAVRSSHKDLPEGVREVYQENRAEYYRELETAHIWIIDTYLPMDVVKKQGQVYIQVKHWSSITLKSFNMDEDKFRLSEECVGRAMSNAENMDYILSGSSFDEATCRSGFLFRGTFERVGSSRSDILFDSSARHKVLQKLGLPDSRHYLLYAPTFRNEKQKTFSTRFVWTGLDFTLLKQTLEQKFGGTWSVFLRLHPVVAIHSSELDLPDFVIDASTYDDSQELVAASDILITDYSSIMFEPAFVKKPVFLYAPDRDTYVNEERQLLLDYDELPFPIAVTNEELADKISAFDEEQYGKDLDAFFTKYDVHEDGHASERAADFILGLIGERQG